MALLYVSRRGHPFLAVLSGNTLMFIQIVRIFASYFESSISSVLVDSRYKFLIVCSLL